VSPSRLFSEYAYFSSFSETMLGHAEELARQLIARETLGSDSLVVELASNDGYLLQFFQRQGLPVLGVEPAQNIARYAEQEKGIPTIARFFSEELARAMVAEGRRAQVVIGNNVLAHVPDLNDFVRGVRHLLAPGGIAVFEVPYIKDMLDGTEFDTIYHEHGCYFSLTALRALFERSGMHVVDVERIAIHGGSIRVSAAHAGSRGVSERVDDLLHEEQAWAVDGPEPYAHFARAVHDLKARLLDLLSAIRDGGERIAAYGAAAKGVTLLSFCGIGAQYLEFVVDRSTHKQGKLFPVGGLPIYAPAALLERRPTYALLLTWNFADEILRQQSEYIARGGQFILPVPEPRVITRD
jgi:SAM-dependent methyltransferase